METETCYPNIRNNGRISYTILYYVRILIYVYIYRNIYIIVIDCIYICYIICIYVFNMSVYVLESI